MTEEEYTSEQLLADILTMIELLEQDMVYGPYGLWDGVRWYWLDKDLKPWVPDEEDLSE